MTTVTDLHDAAVEAGEAAYIDPETGFRVFTEAKLLERGRCCGCGCRHCPYQHENVALDERAAKIQNPAWLTESNLDADVLLFWSGGKDSYLALRALQRQEPKRSIALLSTFDAGNRIVAHQELPIEDLIDQAHRLGVALLGIPLSPSLSYESHIENALSLFPNKEGRALAFGDLHLQHILEWREKAFADLVSEGWRLEFPVWKVSYDELLLDFESSGAGCVISAVTDDRLKDAVGKTFNRAFVESLPNDIDAFGENGEFHTRIIPVGHSSR